MKGHMVQTFALLLTTNFSATNQLYYSTKEVSMDPDGTLYAAKTISPNRATPTTKKSVSYVSKIKLKGV